MSHLRPGNKETAKSIYEAVSAIASGDRWVAVESHYSKNCAELVIDDEQQFWSLVLESLNEIKTAIPHKCYAGHYPPEKSGEPEIKGLELWPFRWTSKLWGEKLRMDCPNLDWDHQMFLKFVINKNTPASKSKYGHVDIHKNRG